MSESSRRSPERDPQHTEDGPGRARTEGESPCQELFAILREDDKAAALRVMLEAEFGRRRSGLCEWLMQHNDWLGCTPAEAIRQGRFRAVYSIFETE